MENKNNLIVVLLVILIGIASGVGLLIGINNAVGVALSPLNAKLAEIERAQKSLENKLNAQGNANNSVPLADIQKELGQIQEKISAIGANAPQPQRPQPPAEDMNKVYTIDPGTSPILGKKDARVTIVEFADFQCPFCQRFFPPIKDVLAAYPDKVRVIIKNFPLSFHPNARPAAKLALAANEQGKYQGMMESLLTNSGDVSDAKIKEYAKNLGLDYNKLMADYKNKDAQWEKQIQDDEKLAQSVDVMGTPTFYLNGRKTNARDISSFKSQIDPILKG
ncbi:MAG: thioredoxin domain-containing protein [Candidatus Omnitrophica bacterium]|nr:thioredoxin domain-containing protein [Candidatus Omnitrophota bacterium]